MNLSTHFLQITVCREVASLYSRQIAGGGGPSTNAPPVTTRYKKFLPFNQELENS